MKKSPLIIIPAILIGLTGAYALVANLLPDTPAFPRVPTGDGTIGGYITRILGVSDLVNYAGDGTVENTASLSGGLTALDILRARTDCTGGTVFHSIDASGVPTCSADFVELAFLGTGTTISGSVSIYHADGTFSGAVALGATIKEGDIIKTDPGAGITITFTDGSLLRLDGDTTVSLEVGQTQSGQTLAYAILENGGLWGRVLSETGGYYIGNDDLIAGVRGTSVELNQTMPMYRIDDIRYNTGTSRWDIISSGQYRPQWNLGVIHSRTREGEAAAHVECGTASGTSVFDLVKGQQLNIYTYPGMNVCEMTKQQAENNRYTRNADEYYQDSTYGERYRANTLADLAYMTGMLSRGGMSESKASIFREEFAATQPQTQGEKDAICNTPGMSTKTYWSSLIGLNTAHFAPCQEKITLAYANYAQPDSQTYKNLYLSGASIFGSGTLGEANKPRIVYTGSQIKKLFSGNVTIKIDGTISGSSNPLSQDIISIGTGSSYLRAYVVSGRIKFTTAGTTLSGSISDGPMNIGISKSSYAYTLKVNSSTIGTLNFSTNPEQLYLGKNYLGGSNWNGLTYNFKINN